MKRKSTLYEGLHLKYTGNVIMIYGMAISLVMLLFAAASIGLGAVLMAITALLAVLASIAGLIIELVGTIKLRTEHHDYQTAVILTIVNFALGFVPVMEGPFGKAFDLGRSAVSLAVIFFFVRATNAFLERFGYKNVADRGNFVWKLTVVLAVAGIVLEILSLWSAITAVSNIMLLVVGIVRLGAFVRYLQESSEALKYLPEEELLLPPEEL